MNEEKIALLTQKIVDRTITPGEFEQYQQWLLQDDGKEYHVDAALAREDLQERMFSSILSRTALQLNRRKSPLWPRIAVAASLIIGIFFLTNHYREQSMKKDLEVYTSDIPGGKNSATLTLANGKKIKLDETADGEIAVQNGISIIKGENGQIIYEIHDEENHAGQVNTLSTANGETYALILPDQTKVWLNAASSITYSPGLLQNGKRRISLTGEGYFEVAKDKHHPFIVSVDKQEIEVIGTHFNVSNYREDESLTATLLEGGIKLTSSIGKASILKPGEQARVSKAGNISVADNVNVQDVVAWKNGYFTFSESLESIMNKLSRWYDVEVVYQDGVDKEYLFGGELSRSKGISSALKIMEMTDKVHFKIEGRRVTVMK